MNPVEVALQQDMRTIAHLSERLAIAAIELAVAGEQLAAEKAHSAALAKQIEDAKPKESPLRAVE